MRKNRGEKTRRAARRFARFGRGLCRVVFWGYVATTVFASWGVVASENDGRFVWREVENGVELVRYYDMESFEVVIPSEVNGKPVTSIDENAFSRCRSLSSLTLPAGLTSIGDRAFSGCRALVSIDVAEGNRFFRSVDGVLFTADGKTLVHYPAGKKATEYAVPTGVTTIGDDAFWDCSSLSSLALLAEVTSIGDDAFWDCSSLSSLALPAEVTSIGDGAFSLCISLSSLALPAGVTSIGDDAFSYCKALVSINVAEGNASYRSVDGVLFTADGKTLVCYPRGKKATEYAVPAGVTSIGDDAFSGCRLLGSLALPEGLTSIGDDAFWGCSSLGSLALPAGVTSIGDAAFFGCASLSSLALPAGLTSIGDRAFAGCASLSSLDVAEGNRFFRSVDGVLFTADGKTLVCYPPGKKATEYAVPEGGTTIGDDAFYGCKSLASITFPASVESVGFSAFAECAPGLVLRAPAGSFMEKYKLPKVKKVK